MAKGKNWTHKKNGQKKTPPKPRARDTTPYIRDPPAQQVRGTPSYAQQVRGSPSYIRDPPDLGEDSWNFYISVNDDIANPTVSKTFKLNQNQTQALSTAFALHKSLNGSSWSAVTHLSGMNRNEVYYKKYEKLKGDYETLMQTHGGAVTFQPASSTQPIVRFIVTIGYHGKKHLKVQAWRNGKVFGGLHGRRVTWDDDKTAKQNMTEQINKIMDQAIKRPKEKSVKREKKIFKCRLSESRKGPMKCRWSKRSPGPDGGEGSCKEKNKQCLVSALRNNRNNRSQIVTETDWANIWGDVAGRL